MRILYDNQIFSCSEFGGISRYFCEIVSYYSKWSGEGVSLPLLFSNNEYLREISLFDYYPFKVCYFFEPLNNLFIYQSNLLKSISLLRKREYDIFHPTYYDPYFLRYLNGTPYVVTVYDMVEEALLHLFTPREDINRFVLFLAEKLYVRYRVLFGKKTVCEQADSIITLSTQMRDEIVRFYGIDPSRIHVVPLASSMDITTSTGNCNLRIPDRFILYVGTRADYKNFEYFLSSINKLLLRDPELYLVCAGSNRFSKNETDLMQRLKVSDKVVHIKFSTNAELAYLYKLAEVFVFPSLYEGFGIPVIEALSCGCPAAVSNIGAFREIAEGSAMYFDPRNSDSIYENVYKVLYENGIKEDLRVRGLERSKYFSWKKTAEMTLEVYGSVLKGREKEFSGRHRV